MKNMIKTTRCRFCKKKNFKKVFSFGPTPLANAFLKKSQLKKKEFWYPLDVYFCKNCHLLQLRDIVSSEILFKDYVYVSSTSPVFVKHFENFAISAIRRFRLIKKSLVIDIGSNDGILLKPFKEKDIKVLGIEPATNIAKIAERNGIETIPQFFSVKLASGIRKKYGPAALVTATNVFAHINDLDEVLKGLQILLGANGVFVIEAPYLVDFIEKNLFDTVYHEHLSYLAINPLINLFKRFHMKVFDVERVASHGGSIRVYSARNNASYKTKKSVSQFSALEKKMKLHQLKTYQAFAKRVEQNKESLLKMLRTLKKKRKSVAGYGAPAKGNTLLNYFGIDGKTLDYIVDDSKHKQGLFTPGTHIPVTAPEKLYKDSPDYVLILAWNFAQSIMKKHKQLYRKGVKFIIPVPKPRIA